jgi:hypothetical protein
VTTSVVAGWKEEPLGRALVFRLWPARRLHAVGDSPLAAEFRQLVTAGAVPGWDLHLVPAWHTPLHVLAGPLHHLSDSDRFYNLLERKRVRVRRGSRRHAGGLLVRAAQLRTRFIAAVRQVIAGLQPGDAQPGTGSLPRRTTTWPGRTRPSPQRVPGGEHHPPRATVTGTGTQHIRRKPVLGGPINEYTHAA